MARGTGRKFDEATILKWRKRYLTETLEDIGGSVFPPLPGAMVYYHIRKLGTLPSKRRGVQPGASYTERAPRKMVAEEIAVPVELVAPVCAIKESTIRPLTPAEMMVGRARIPRRIERLQGVEA